MSIVITNKSALYSNLDISKNVQKIDSSIKKLSSGHRIQRAGDDISGIVSAGRMEAKIRGLTSAASSQKTGLNVLYTAEGATNSISNLLQKMRELALQSATDTIRRPERELIQKEVDQIKIQINKIAIDTKLDRTNLLDGSYQGHKVQTGSNALVETVDINLRSAKTEDMTYLINDGIMRVHTTPYLFSDTSLLTSAGGGQPPANKIVANTVRVTGDKEGENISITTAMTAKELAAAITAKADKTGVSATAVTKVQLYNMNSASDISFRLGAASARSVDSGSGTLISATVTNVTDLSSIVDAINAKSIATGVSATSSDTLASVILTDADGDDIFISHLDFDPEGILVSNNPGANQNNISVRILDSDGIPANQANSSLNRGVGTDDTVTLIDPHRHQHIDVTERVVSITLNQPGSGYQTAPTVSVQTNSYAGSVNATASATLEGGATSKLGAINTPGVSELYQFTPWVSIAPPPTLTFDVSSAADINDNIFSVNNHGFNTGELVTYYGGSDSVGGLNSGRTYYAIKINSNEIAFATSASNAASGTRIDITGVPQDFNAKTEVDIGTNKITIANHGFADNEQVVYRTGFGTQIPGLTNGASYYVVTSTKTTNAFQLATSSNGTAIDFGAAPALSFNVANNVSTAHNTITINNHQLSNDDTITYSKNGGTKIVGLDDSSTYHVVNKTTNTFQIAATQGGSAVDILGNNEIFVPPDKVTDGTDTIIATNHGFSHNQEVIYTNMDGSEPNIQGLGNGRAYFIKLIDANNFQVASRRGGSAIDIAGGVDNGNTHRFVSVTAGSSETQTFTVGTATITSQTHSITGKETNNYSSQNHSIKGITATATAVLGSDGNPDPVYRNDITQDYERSALAIGTAIMTNNLKINIDGDHVTEEFGFLGAGMGYLSAGGLDGQAAPGTRSVSDVNVETIFMANESLKYIDVGINKINEMRAEIGATSNRVSSSLDNTVTAIMYSEKSQGDIIDLDYAREATTYAVTSMVQDTSTALLAQANVPREAVSILLRNVMGFSKSLAFL